MYPNELEQFIKARNYYLGGDDLMLVTSTIENPQLNHLKYEPYENKYKMWDKEGHYYELTPMPYEEAKSKRLVKRIDK